MTSSFVACKAAFGGGLGLSRVLTVPTTSSLALHSPTADSAQLSSLNFSENAASLGGGNIYALYGSVPSCVDCSVGPPVTLSGGGAMGL